MECDEIFSRLGKLTEEMYYSIEKVHHSEIQDQLVEYHAKVAKRLKSVYIVLERVNSGDVLIKFKREIRVLIDDFIGMENRIGSKYKVYIRGGGKAGKSTLLNALLSLDEESGSKMGRLPMTFTIDTYSDEMEKNYAEIRMIDINGNCKRTRMLRSKAIKERDSEEEKFRKSKEKCDIIIKEKTNEVYLEDIIEDVKYDIYKKNLLKTSIREIKWGIGENNFFHNCMLVDTPGLSQDLRFTNELEEIKNYEVDGIVWVIASNQLTKVEVVNSYKREFEEFKNVYKGKKVIGVINMYGTGPDYEYYGEKWKKKKREAEHINPLKYGLDSIILVNAQLAYYGNILQNSDMIEKSNINQLRKKINEMFIEKTSEEYMVNKLEQIDLFVNKFSEKVEEECQKLEGVLKEYNDNKEKIFKQRIISKRKLREELSFVLENHIKLIDNRIEQNIVKVNNLYKESYYSRDMFIREQIFEISKFEKQVEDITMKYYYGITEKFRELQKRIVISEFKTEQYAFDVFKEQCNIPLITNKIGKCDLIFPNTIGDSISEFITDSFGKSVANIFNGIRNVFVSPKERLINQARQALVCWVNEVNLDEEIDDCVNQCMVVLNESMLHTYGAYEDIVTLVKYMNNFIGNKPHEEWVDIKLKDIIGGIQDV